MQTGRFINIRTLFFNREVLADSSQELFRCQTVQVFDNTVIIDNCQLVSGEANSHEVVVFFVTGMIRILFRFFSSHQSSGSTTMMSVGNVEGRHLSKFLSDGINIFLFINNPESMSETIAGSDKVVHWLSGSIMSDNSIQSSIVRICKEYRFDIGIVHANMLHAVFFLIAAGQFMLFDDTVHIVGNISANYQTILRLSIHGLRIDVIVFFIVLHQPAFILEHLEIFSSFLINTFIMFVSAYRKIYFGLNDMIQGFLVSFRFFARFC